MSWQGSLYVYGGLPSQAVVDVGAKLHFSVHATAYPGETFMMKFDSGTSTWQPVACKDDHMKRITHSGRAGNTAETDSGHMVMISSAFSVFIAGLLQLQTQTYCSPGVLFVCVLHCTQ